MAIKMNKCDHIETKSLMVSVRNTKLLDKVFNDHHPGTESDEFAKGYILKSQCKTELNLTDTFKVVEEFVNKFYIKYIEFTCVCLQNSLSKLIEEAAESATKKDCECFPDSHGWWTYLLRSKNSQVGILVIILLGMEKGGFYEHRQLLNTSYSYHPQPFSTVFISHAICRQ